MTTKPPAAFYTKESEQLERLKNLVDAIHAGFGGILPNGNIVDRRNFPSATPLLANATLGTPDPKPVIKKP